jgi:gas vesicle protein
MEDSIPKRSGGPNLASFILGLGVGLGLSFLLTPRSGEENRQLIAEKTKEGVDYAAVAIGELKDQVQAQLSNAEVMAQDLKGRVGDRVGSLKDRVQEALRAGQQAYREDLQQRESEQDRPSSQAASSGS